MKLFHAGPEVFSNRSTSFCRSEAAAESKPNGSASVPEPSPLISDPRSADQRPRLAGVN